MCRSEFPMIIVGNKSDLERERVVSSVVMSKPKVKAQVIWSHRGLSHKPSEVIKCMI